MHYKPNDATHYSYFQNDIDYFKKDIVKGCWFVYDKCWVSVDMSLFFKYQTIKDINMLDYENENAEIINKILQSKSNESSIYVEDDILKKKTDDGVIEIKKLIRNTKTNNIQGKFKIKK